MQQAEGAEAPIKVEFDNFEHGFSAGFRAGRLGLSGLRHRHRLCRVPAVCRGLQLPAQPGVRGIHVGFLLFLSFGLIGNFTARTDLGRALGWMTGTLACLRALSVDFLRRFDARDGDPTHVDSRSARCWPC